MKWWGGAEMGLGGPMKWWGGADRELGRKFLLEIVTNYYFDM